MKTVRFRIDRPAAGIDILAGNQKLQHLTYDAVLAVIPIVEAQFFQEFGVEGKFTVTEYLTDRYNAALRADNAQTMAVLKKHPGWLGQFTQDMKI